uniref:Uncharacterized protein n=1 Tax=Romanomermis culicivorax TaxID=13658 RepID=A0A915L1Z2_ROMCU
MFIKFTYLIICIYTFREVDSDSMVHCYSCMDVGDCVDGHCLGDYCASITINNVGFSTVVKTCVDDSVRTKYISEDRPCRRYDFSNGFLTDVCICGSNYCNV